MTNEPTPAGQNAAADPLRPPRAVKVAAVLWICTGALLVMTGLGTASNPHRSSSMIVLFFTQYCVGVGVAVFVFTAQMRRGSDRARNALIVFGFMALLTILPLPLVVPALVLQFRPVANAWFAAVDPTGRGKVP